MRTEARLPCPVCLGLKLDKVKVSEPQGELALDACRRCGGVWFELGEVQRLRRHEPRALLERLPDRRTDVRTLCHACHAPLDRAAESCGACGEANRLDCPSCARPLQRQAHGTLILDVCEQCRGVWFDRAELQGIWQLELDRAIARRSVPDGVQPALHQVVLLDALFWAPDAVFYGLAAGGHLAGEAASAAAGMLSGAPEAVAGAAEAVGEAAGSLFETIAEIIGSIFS